MNNVAGLFDPGGPATVARAKRMCNSLGRSPSFSKKESASISPIFVENGQFSKKECAPISLIFVENYSFSKNEKECAAISLICVKND